VDGLMANLLISKQSARGKTAFKDWLEENKDRVGLKYASEIKRHYQPNVIARSERSERQSNLPLIG